MRINNFTRSIFQNAAGAIAGIPLLTAGWAHAVAAESSAEETAATSPSAEGKTLPRIKVIADIEEDADSSPYRTGGDVDVVTREEIEEYHYLNIEDALKRVPGVQVSGTGNHSQEYGLATYNEEVSINGDNSVIIMVDGRRLDSDVSSFGGSTSRSKVSLNTITNIANVERIEIIKGTGGVAYGADATGGVINIVTRQGGLEHETSIDVALGSWKKQKYALTQSGSFGEGSLRYFVALNHDESASTKYKDAYLDRTVTWYNTAYQDTGGSLRLSKEFNEDHELTFYYSETNDIAGYPITAPDYSTIHLFYEGNLPYGSGASSQPGYRNWFIYDASLDSYSRSRSRDADLKYAFDKGDGLESYVRLFRNYRRYKTRLFGGLFGIQYPDLTSEDIETAKSDPGRKHHETVNGAQLQLARKLGRHELMTGWTYDINEYEDHRVSQNTHTFIDRDSITGFLQDKFEITNWWTVTPGVQYSQYSEIKNKSASGVVTQRDESRSHVTFAAYTNFKTGLFGDLYASWAEIFKPKTNNDFSNESSAETLQDEQGESWTVGLKKTLWDNTAIDINYAMTDMSNAIARYSIWDPTATNTSSPTGLGNWVTRSVNATQRKKAFNVGIDHRFNDHWALRSSYAYVYENFAAKNWQNNPDDTNINAQINNYRPANKYRADLSYWRNKWSATLSTELSGGIEERYFTDNHFLWFGLTANYDLFEKTRLYLTVDNLTNIHYETRGHASYGPGTFPQPARNFMVGVTQKF